MMDRRSLLRAAFGAGAAATVAGLPAALGSRRARAEGLGYRELMPELFAPLPRPPEHSEALVIGTGFGGAVTAYRLAEAGVQVTMLERGSRWPTDAHRPIHTQDVAPDGRGFWHQQRFTRHKTSLLGITGVPYLFDDFAGVLDITDLPGMQVFSGACVGGGSIVYTGATVQPERPLFERLFGGSVDYTEMDREYYPRARRRLGATPIPDDLYQSPPFARHRLQDAYYRHGGYQLQRPDSIFRPEVLRDELAGHTRASATIGESNFGNANAAKRSLPQTYLAWAEATGHAAIYPGQQVHAVGQDHTGRYLVHTSMLTPTGQTIETRTLTCDRLFLAAGSLGTTALLLRARAEGALPRLSDQVGAGWGGNGDAMLLHGVSLTGLPGPAQAAPCTTRILDTHRAPHPVGLEGWYIPGLPPDLNMVASLAMVADDIRGRLDLDTTGRLTLRGWPADADQQLTDTLRPIQQHLHAANPLSLPPPPGIGLDIVTGFTAHPLGGAVAGAVCDTYGRVTGHPGLYVVDGATIPGSTGCANPSLTITALAERALDNILTQRG